LLAKSTRTIIARRNAKPIFVEIVTRLRLSRKTVAKKMATTIPSAPIQIESQFWKEKKNFQEE
jgi:hypothetical protein